MFSVALQMYPVKYLVSEVQQGDCSMKRDRNSFWCVEQTVGTDQQIAGVNSRQTVTSVRRKVRRRTGTCTPATLSCT